MRKAQLDFLLRQIMKVSPLASDILMLKGKEVQVEIDGVLQDAKMKPEIGELTSFQIEEMGKALIGDRKNLYFLLFSTGACDFSYEIYGSYRFRVNLFLQRQTFGIVMRKLPLTIPSQKQLGLPKVVDLIKKEKEGIIFVTGATGQGKSTTIAQIIDSITKTIRKHIITLEDPIEFVFHHNLSTVNQREFGSDFYSFSDGLRSALRSAPKIIFVGEIRDIDTLRIAMRAAETGHLVFATFHTYSVTQTINSIIGMFPSDEEAITRRRLSSTLKYVISQRLMPKISGGRIAAFEILGNNLRVQDLILNGESIGEEKTFYNIMEVGMDFMQTFDQNLLRLFTEDTISYATAMQNAGDKTKLRMRIDAVRTARGENSSDIGSLELE